MKRQRWFCMCKYFFLFPSTGSIVELKYALLSYGIPSDLLPLDNSGSLLLDKFHSHLQTLEAVEKHEKELRKISKLVHHPTRFDILLGRGRPYQEFSRQHSIRWRSRSSSSGIRNMQKGRKNDYKHRNSMHNRRSIFTTKRTGHRHIVVVMGRSWFSDRTKEGQQYISDTKRVERSNPALTTALTGVTMSPRIV